MLTFSPRLRVTPQQTQCLTSPWNHFAVYVLLPEDSRSAFLILRTVTFGLDNSSLGKGGCLAYYTKCLAASVGSIH